MGHSKATDEMILDTLAILKQLRDREWREQFGPDLTPFAGFRREEIQRALSFYKDTQYSDGGMRGRLKKMVEDGLLQKFRISERTVFYLKPNQ